MPSSPPPVPYGPGHYVTLPGVDLWYIDSGGSGTPVVLLHANTGTVTGWQLQIDALSQAGYRAIAFDRRGWGKSRVNAATGPQPGSVADDLEALVQHLNLPRFHLIGIAGGGFVALDYAAWHPERLISMVVAASNGQFHEKEMDEFSRRIAVPGLEDPKLRIYREVGVAYRAADPEGLARFAAMEHSARHPDAPAQPMRTPNTFAKIAQIRLPVLIMTAGADLLAPPALMHAWSRHLPDKRHAHVPDAGHSINWEQPQAFNRLVLQHLKETS